MEEPPLDPPAKISSRLPSGQNSPRRELPGFDLPGRPIPSRSQSGFEGPTSLGNGASTPPDNSMRPLSRVPTDSSQISNMRLNLRSTQSKDSGYGANVFEDADSEVSDAGYGNGHGSYGRSPSWSQGANGDWASGKKAPPPPPPSRAKKPPPPPPMKRSALSTSEVPHY